MTDDELHLCKLLRRVKVSKKAVRARRFIKDMVERAENHCDWRLTAGQRRYLLIVAHRFRRQMPQGKCPVDDCMEEACVKKREEEAAEKRQPALFG